jgi:predicted GNAT family N-acyltransferase
MQIKLIDTGTKAYEEMAALRRKVLLAPIGIPPSYINPQQEAKDILIGAFEKDRLVGCCVLTKLDVHTVQLRQMAVDASVQKKGIGAALLLFAESLAKEKGYQTLMMHARDEVLDFYKKCGYQITGEQFFEVGIGHHKMERALVVSIK